MELNPEQKNRVTKYLSFNQNKDLALFNELQELNASLKQLVQKETPEVPETKFPDVQTVRVEGLGYLKGDQGDQGIQGIPGEPGRDGFDGMNGRDGIDGKDAPLIDEQGIIERVITHIPQPIPGEPGKDAEPIDEEELLKSMLKMLKKKKLLDVSYIKGLEGFSMDGIRYKFEELFHGAGTSGTTTTFVDNEIVSGSGTSWTLADTPILGSVQLYGNGQFLTPGVGNDYTISGTSITTANSFSSSTIVANYRT